MLRRLGGIESAARLAIASLSASWALGLGAHRGQRAVPRELSALQFAERLAERTAPGAPARLPGPRARPEHERRPGRRLTGEQRALIENEEPPVEELADLDATAGVRAPAAAGRDLHPAQASAALSNPARGTSFLLIMKVSMGGHFHRTDREDSSI